MILGHTSGILLFFSSHKAYVQLIGTRQVHPAYSWLWKSCCQNKRKVFFRLLMKDRISTRNLLKRKHMALDDYNCAICSIGTEETLIHLFLDCPFAMSCWSTLGLFILNPNDPSDNCFLQRSAKSSFLHGSNHLHVLDNLVSLK